MHARTDTKQASINYSVLGLILLDSAHLYLAGKSVAGTWDGLVHGKKGKLRAERLIKYLKYCGIEKAQSSDEGPSEPEINKKGLLALLLAIFGEASSWIFRGRSSRLVSLIAHRMIRGNNVDVINSDAGVVPLEYSIFYYFDPIWGVRSWLREALRPFSSEISELKDSAKILEKKLINESLEIKPVDLIGHPDWVPKARKAVCAEDSAGCSPILTLFWGYQKTLLSDDNHEALIRSARKPNH